MGSPFCGIIEEHFYSVTFHLNKTKRTFFLSPITLHCGGFVNGFITKLITRSHTAAWCWNLAKPLFSLLDLSTWWNLDRLAGDAELQWSIAPKQTHDGVIKWKHFPRYWPLVRGIRRSPVKSPHNGRWCGALMFSLICAWINGWVNNREADDLTCYNPHCNVTVMKIDLAKTLYYPFIVL